jgi:ABC-type polysaccharide/polyol phosphate transport system ATPase subunit
MTELINSKAAAVLVTHDLDAAREMATKALWIDHGKVMKYGEVNSVIDAYINA